MPIFGLPQMLRGIDLCWSVVSLLGRGCQSTRRLDLSQIEKDHLFTVLEEKLDYLANLEELVRKKAFKAHLRKKIRE
jgi:hypothetical protein